MALRSRPLLWLLTGALMVAWSIAPEPAPASNQTRAAASQPPPRQPARPQASPSAEPAPSAEPTPIGPPVWVVGAQPLSRRRDGYGAVRATPPALVDRRLPTVDGLAPPTSGGFESTISPVPPPVLARSTWRPACPVPADQLRYLTMSFHGFDGRVHTGEMLVNAKVAQDVVGIFEQLFAAGFPIEEMRVTAAPELDLPPTGDGNNTNAFVCRTIVNQGNWSAHAYGLAIDLNPFHNPYILGDLVVPELASSYLERNRVRPGMVLAGSPAVKAFEAAGWTWGGRWSAPVDFMHFSATGH
ncbi:MAG: M15 family metallopeptidase [Pseudonocardiaceae bacterium]